LANTIKIDILADVKDINKGIKDVNTKLDGFNTTLGKVGTALKTAFVAGAAAVVGGGLVTGLKDSIGAASDLNETVSKTQTVFGTASKDIQDFASNAATSLGLSSQEALAGAAQFGNLFDQIGIGKKAAADMSKGFLKMSADLGSFNNADPSAVMEAFQSATRGEFDSLQQFIPTINAATLQTEALRLSHKKSADQLTEADKANALYSLSVKGMGKAQGDFAKTSGGLANQQRILSARFKDAQADLGQKLLPIALKAVTFFNANFGPATQKLGDVFKQVGTVIKNDVLPPIQAVTGFVKDNATAFLAGAAAIAAVATAVGIYKTVMTTVSAVTKAYTAVQAALNVVLALNPIGLVVLALVALAAIFVVLWKRSTTFRTIVTGAFEAVKTGVKAVINFFKGLPGSISKAVGSLKDLLKSKGVDLIVGFAKGYINTYASVIKFFAGVGKGIVRYVGNVARTLYQKGSDFIGGLLSGVGSRLKALQDFFGGLRSKATGYIGNVTGSLKQKGVDFLSGLISGLGSKLKSFTDYIAGLPGKAKTAIGDVGKTLYTVGQNLLQGMIGGLKSKASDLASAALSPVKDAVSGVKGFLGINSPSKLFKGFGVNINQGLVLGLERVSGVKSAATGLAGAVADGFNKNAPELEMSATGTAGSGGDTYNIYLNGTFLGNKRELGQLFQEAVLEAQRFNRPRLVTM
jgi:phage-related protein